MTYLIQIDYSHLMKQRKNSCCLSGSEFTSFGLNLVTVFSRRCFSFLSNVHRIKDLKRNHRSVVLLVLLNASRHRQHRLTHFFAIKKKEYLVRGAWGCINPNYKITNINRFYVIQSRQAMNLIHSPQKTKIYTYI